LLQLLRNAEVYAPESLGSCDLLIGGGKVLWLGSDCPDVPAELLEASLDLAGQRLLPGLIDGHAHYTGGGGESGFSTRVPPLALGAFVEAGITSAIGVLGTDDVVRSTAELLATARGLAELGFGAFCLTGGYHYPPTTLTGSVQSDIVHLDRVIGVGEFALSDHRSSQPTVDELLRVASEAHLAGLMTHKAGVVHLHLGDGARGLELLRRALDQSELSPTVFQPTHVNRRKALFEEALQLAERGCPIDVTAFPIAEGEDAWSAEDAVERFVRAGLPNDRLTVSSDGGGCLPEFDEHGRMTSMDVGRPGDITLCLARLLQRGFDLAQVLPYFTSNVADTWRLTGKGRVAVGADADLILLDTDAKPSDVMLGGVWHVRAGKRLVGGPFEKIDTLSD
jgi:beta-aspartyl-dipeptidase (metallo-type)